MADLTEYERLELANMYPPGSVFQINEEHGRNGWIGAFVLAEEVYDWGVQGFVCCVKSHDEQLRHNVRLPWQEIDYIGRTDFMPDDCVPDF